MHPLAGVWAKLDRGDEHVRIYEREEGRPFRRKKPPRIGVAVHINKETGTAVLLVTSVPALPPKLAVIIADAIHNYRSALDQLIFELAFMDTRGRELESTAFPASDTLVNFEGEKVKTRLLAGLTKQHRAQLKRFQPYRGWKSPGPHPFRLLNDLSNDDKHRLTQPALVHAQTFRMRVLNENCADCRVDVNTRIEWNKRSVGRPLEPDTEVCRFPVEITGPNPQVTMEGGVDTFVGFRNGIPVLPALWEIRDHTRRVVEFFAPEFERPCALRLRDLPRRGRIHERTDQPATKWSQGWITESGETVPLPY